MTFPVIAITVFVLLVLLAIFAAFAIKEKRKEFKRTGKYPEGHYIGLGMALGMAIGMPFGVALENIALGPGLGLPIGLAIGMALEKKNKDKLRPLTEKEKEIQKKAVIMGLAFLVLFVIIGLIAFFSGR